MVGITILVLFWRFTTNCGRGICTVISVLKPAPIIGLFSRSQLHIAITKTSYLRKVNENNKIERDIKKIFLSMRSPPSFLPEKYQRTEF
jgi:hypothetical protein